MDAIFKALADPARRTLLDALRREDGQSLQQLQQLLDMTRFGVMKHLGVLEQAHLIVTKKQGRFKYHYLNVVPLQEAIDRWIEPMLVKPVARAVIDLKTQLERETTMTKPDFMMQTFINCTQDALWHALTDAETNAKTNFIPCVGTREGPKMSFAFEDGSLMLVCTDTKVTPKTRIECTFEPHWAGPDEDLAHSRLVYIIEPQADHCVLTLEHYDLPQDQQEGVADGWHRSIAGMKTYLETGKVVRFADPNMME